MGIVIALIVIVVVIGVVALVALPRLRAAQEEKRLQSQRQEVADRHHAEADAKAAHADKIERKAEAERAEVELAERQAEARRAEIDVAERKAAAARADADVSRVTASRTEEGLADDTLEGGTAHRGDVADTTRADAPAMRPTDPREDPAAAREDALPPSADTDVRRERR